MKTATRTPLPERIRAARISRGLSQAAAAEAVGYTREHVNKFERGGVSYSPELAYKLARLLGVRVSVDDLFAGVEP